MGDSGAASDRAKAAGSGWVPQLVAATPSL